MFHDVAYKARNREDLLAGIDEFLDMVTVLPPGEWDPTIRIEPPKTVPSQVGSRDDDGDGDDGGRPPAVIAAAPFAQCAAAMSLIAVCIGFYVFAKPHKLDMPKFCGGYAYFFRENLHKSVSFQHRPTPRKT